VALAERKAGAMLAAAVPDQGDIRAARIEGRSAA